jgi:chromosome segregation ATPase
LKWQSQIIESNPTPGYLDIPSLSKSRKLTGNRKLKSGSPDICVSEIWLSTVDIDELEVDKGKLQGEINQLRIQKKELEGECEVIQLHLLSVELEADRDTLQCEICQLSSHKNELEFNKNQVASEIIHLVSEKYDLNVDKDKLHSEIRHLMLEKHEISKMLIKEKENLLEEKFKAENKASLLLNKDSKLREHVLMVEYFK